MLAHNNTEYANVMCWMSDSVRMLRFYVKRPDWHYRMYPGNREWHVATIVLPVGEWRSFAETREPLQYRLEWTDRYALSFPKDYSSPVYSCSLTYLMKEVEFIAMKSFFSGPVEQRIR